MDTKVFLIILAERLGAIKKFFTLESDVLNPVHVFHDYRQTFWALLLFLNCTLEIRFSDVVHFLWKTISLLNQNSICWSLFVHLDEKLFTFHRI